MITKEFVDIAYSYFDPNDPWSGTENVSPLLYTLARMRRARVVVEYGAGLSTLFLAQAMKDNHHDVNDSLHLLNCFEKLPYGSDYVARLRRALHKLQLNSFVDVFAETPWSHARIPYEIDLAWNDDAHYGKFLQDVWPKLTVGGFVGFHDTVLNHTERGRLNRTLDSFNPDHETLTIDESHKTSQSSITLVRKI